MRECPFFDNFWFDFVSDCKLLYLKKIGFVEEVCFNRLQVFLIWSVNRCVWMLTRDVSCSLQCFFGWSDLWIFVFKSWNLPQSHSMKLKLTTTKKKKPVFWNVQFCIKNMLNSWWWELRADVCLRLSVLIESLTATIYINGKHKLLVSAYSIRWD